MRSGVAAAVLAAVAAAIFPAAGSAAPVRSPESLLLHRVAALQARVPHHAFYLGADKRDRLRLGRTFWTRGFFAGSLWQASALAPRRRAFPRSALARTRANFGGEGADSHDLGFVYELSSVAAYRRLCRRRRGGPLCRRLRRSGLAAARRLNQLAASNPGPGTIPTRLRSGSRTESQTIVDSLMNLPLLYWAARQTGRGNYRRLARRHAHTVVRELVRPDGSTTQSVHHDRHTGEVLRKQTNQGLSTHSTWSRGQGWAVYGLTASATALRDPLLLGAAERAAGWVADHLPASGLPRWDYDAPPGSPVDTSAGAITAAGLYRLAAACKRLTCAQGRRWRPLADRMLGAVLKRVSRRPPLGYLRGCAGAVGRGPAWDDDAELVYGLYYTLEALNLRGRRSASS